MVYRQLYHIGHSINKQVCKATNLTYYTPRDVKTSYLQNHAFDSEHKRIRFLKYIGGGRHSLICKTDVCRWAGDVFQGVESLQFPRGVGGRATPLYKPYKYVPPLRVGFLRRFGLKTGISWFCPFWSGSGYGFTKELRLRINVFVVSFPKE